MKSILIYPLLLAGLISALLAACSKSGGDKEAEKPNAEQTRVRHGTNGESIVTLDAEQVTAEFDILELTGPTNISVASFSAACSGGGTCIPQRAPRRSLIHWLIV